MYMIKISKDKVDHLAETAEKMLRLGGKMMQCLEELQEPEAYGQRMDDGELGYSQRDDIRYRYPETSGMGMRGGYGMRSGMGMRDDREEMDERRGRNSMGRYSRM